MVPVSVVVVPVIVVALVLTTLEPEALNDPLVVVSDWTRRVSPVSVVDTPVKLAPLVTVIREVLPAVMVPPVAARDWADRVSVVPFMVILAFVVVSPLPDINALEPVIVMLSPERLVALVELMADVPAR